MHELEPTLTSVLYALGGVGITFIAFLLKTWLPKKMVADIEHDKAEDETRTKSLDVAQVAIQLAAKTQETLAKTQETLAQTAENGKETQQTLDHAAKRIDENALKVTELVKALDVLKELMLTIPTNSNARAGEIKESIKMNGDEIKVLLASLREAVELKFAEIEYKLDAQGKQLEAQGKQLEALKTYLEKTEPVIVPTDENIAAD